MLVLKVNLHIFYVFFIVFILANKAHKEDLDAVLYVFEVNLIQYSHCFLWYIKRKNIFPHTILILNLKVEFLFSLHSPQ